MTVTAKKPEGKSNGEIAEFLSETKNIEQNEAPQKQAKNAPNCHQTANADGAAPFSWWSSLVKTTARLEEKVNSYLEEQPLQERLAMWGETAGQYLDQADHKIEIFENEASSYIKNVGSDIGKRLGLLGDSAESDSGQQVSSSHDAQAAAEPIGVSDHASDSDDWE